HPFLKRDDDDEEVEEEEEEVEDGEVAEMKSLEDKKMMKKLFTRGQFARSGLFHCSRRL
ncbi:hypothetical protein RUM43_001851, partial [Polyplax serrata]